MFARSTKLQEMCLIAVVKEIDYFMYSKTIPEKHLNFLFHVYAEEIFSLHKTLKSYINEDCMMWFLHPRVKTVTLRNFHSKRIIERLKLIGPGITFLNLHKSEIAEKELNSVICCFPHVVHLDLSETSCSNETLTCIRKYCSNLVSLNVSCCPKVSDTGMDNLCGNDRLLLKNLNILYSHVEAEGLFKILNDMPSLERVKYEDLAGLFYRIMEDTGSKFCKKFNLTELVCDNADSARLIETCAELFPKLKVLYFNYPVYPEILHACTHFNDLEELKIKMPHNFFTNSIGDVLTPILPISQNLKTLILSRVKISVLTLVDCFKNLENLFLKKISFMPFKKEDTKIAKTKLLKLVIHGVSMHDNVTNYEGVALLISLSKDVTELHLKHIDKLPIEILDVVLKSMKNLTSVNFIETWLYVHSLSPFFAVSSLTTVIANLFEDTLSPADKFPKFKSSTLSWRYTSDDEDEDNDSMALDGSDSIRCYYYDDDDSNNESDISDMCLSFVSGD